MIRSRFNPDLTRFWDALLGLGAAAYFLSFLAALEIALGKLVY